MRGQHLGSYDVMNFMFLCNSHVNDKACGIHSIFKMNNETVAPRPQNF